MKKTLIKLFLIVILITMGLTSCKTPSYKYNSEIKMWQNTKDSTDTFEYYKPNKVY